MSIKFISCRGMTPATFEDTLRNAAHSTLDVVSMGLSRLWSNFTTPSKPITNPSLENELKTWVLISQEPPQLRPAAECEKSPSIENDDSIPDGWEDGDSSSAAPNYQGSPSSSNPEVKEELVMPRIIGTDLHVNAEEAEHLQFSICGCEHTLHVRSALERMTSNQRLSSTEILFLLNSLSKEAPNTLEIIPDLLLGAPLNPERLQTLLRETEARFIVFPTGLAGIENHVIGIVYDIENRTLEFIDRTGQGPGDRINTKVVYSEQTIKAIFLKLHECLPIERIAYTHTPQQTDHYNCAPFLIDYVEERCLKGIDPEIILSRPVNPDQMRQSCVDRVFQEHLKYYQ